VPFPLLLLAAALSHSPWQETLQRFVTPQARVDYAALNKQGLPTLDAYLATLAQPFPRDVSRDERKAALINAYNALTVRWVAAHYPIPSIWRTKHPFTEVRSIKSKPNSATWATRASTLSLFAPRAAARRCVAKPTWPNGSTRNSPPTRWPGFPIRR
jgi:hypothetical protein